MKRYLIFVILISIVLFSGCSGIEDVQLKKIKDVSYQELKGSMLKLSITATVYNPNFFNIKMKKANMDLILNDKVIGTVSQVEQIEIIGRKEKDYKILVSIEMKDFLSNLMSMYRVLMNERNQLSLSGSVQVRYLLFSKTFQVERISFE